MTVYCGNNRLNNTGNTVGTRYECFKKGIGVGKTLPCDGGPFSPLDDRKVWCGKGEELPRGYDILGNLPMCLQKGVGVGRSMSCIKTQPIYYKPMFWLLISSIIVFIAIVFYMKYKRHRDVEKESYRVK